MKRFRVWFHSRSWRHLGFKLAKGYPCGYDAETGSAWWTGTSDARLSVPRKGVHIHAFCPELLQDVDAYGATEEEAIANWNRAVEQRLSGRW